MVLFKKIPVTLLLALKGIPFHLEYTYIQKHNNLLIFNIFVLSIIHLAMLQDL